MRKFILFLMILTFIFSSCSMFYEENDDFQKGSTITSYESLNSTISSAINSFKSEKEFTTDNISINPLQFKTNFSDEELLNYRNILSNYGMMYDLEYDYYCVPPLGLFPDSNWENINSFNKDDFISWRISLSFRDGKTTQDFDFQYPAEEFEKLVMTYFNVTIDELHESKYYHSEDNEYYLETFGLGPGALPEVKLDSVDDNKAGFLTLYTTISYPIEVEDGEQFRRGQSRRKILTIEYLPENDNYHYISCIDNNYPISEQEESAIVIKQ